MYPSKFPVYDMVALLKDYGVDHSTSGSTVTTGWVGIHCPFCAGTKRYHLGYNLEKGNWHCWRCGSHRLKDVLRAVFGARAASIASALPGYRISGEASTRGRFRRNTTPAPVTVALPGTKGVLHPRAIRYLERRNFDPDRLIEQYDIRSTDQIGSYNFRIVIPVIHMGQVVSYQGRDYTGKSSIKYKACLPTKEAFPIKNTLYGQHLVKSNAVLACEGVTDAWRLGPGAVALYGISYTTGQLLALARYDRVFVLMDKDDDVEVESEVSPGLILRSSHESDAAAKRLVSQLKSLGVEAIRVAMPRPGDPADLSDSEARALMREIIR